MNTDWWITARGARDLQWAEDRVREAEALFSRFRPDSLLARLNRERHVQDRRLASLVGRALELHGVTGGAFDIRVGPALEAAGYDRSFELLDAAGRVPTVAPPVDALSIEVDRDEVRLRGHGGIDLGGIAKGWAIDLVAAALEADGCRDYVIDGGGDIATGGTGADGQPWAIGVGDGLAVRLSDHAVCTSSTARRRWRHRGGEAHHIIDPRSGLPAEDRTRTAVVVARDAATADALATALLANVESGLRAAVLLDADALIDDRGRWEMTGGMERWLA